jgi:HAD superfamily hydrolase (TIGR01509 family)
VQGLRKPDAEVFDRVCTHLDIEPKQAVFIDDRQANVDAAAAHGMQAVLMTTANDLSDRLQNHGVPM